MIPLRRSCKEVAALLIAGEDRELPLTERLALRFHMAACDACPRFRQQVISMRNSLQLWRNYTDSDNFSASGADKDSILQKK